MSRLTSLITTLIAALLLTGCGAPEPEGKLPEDQTPTDGAPPRTGDGTSTDPNATTSTTPESGGGIQIHGGGAGGIAPVTGTESLQGGGSGVGQAAKEKAKEVAGGSGSSAAQMNSEGE
jgi:hypothetical protein